MAKKKASKKAKPQPHVSKKSPAPTEQDAKAAVLPPLEKEVPDVEDEPQEKKDEFFKEEEMKEFTVKDEEEDVDEDAGDDGGGEHAWSEEEV